MNILMNFCMVTGSQLPSTASHFRGAAWTFLQIKDPHEQSRHEVCLKARPT